MKNKNKKLVSLRAILILVQQLQLKYHNQKDIDIDMYNCAFDVTVKVNGKLTAFEFSKFEKENWKANYYKLINKLNG